MLQDEKENDCCERANARAMEAMASRGLGDKIARGLGRYRSNVYYVLERAGGYTHCGIEHGNN